ncbi:MAG: endopeptidase La [Acidimicrobiia bacterium]|nr:endopeptidase La [Acidimicrobiia bacterium]MDX2466233.1 endopeptidase La [Acidimicrobiia bacterium]
MSDITTTSLPVLPLRSGIVFPNMVITVAIESDSAKQALAAAESTGGRLVLIPVVDGKYSSVGTIAEIQEVSDRGGTSAIISGMQRARIGTGSDGSNDVLWVEVEPVAELLEYSPTTIEKATELRAILEEILDNRGIRGIAERMLATEDASNLVDLLVYSPDLELVQKAQLLETLDVEDRLDTAIAWMSETLAGMTIRKRVRDEAAENIDKTQKEFVLRQQMQAIRKELGEDDATVVDEYREKLEGLELPESVGESVERELNRLERLSDQSPEHSWIRTWLDTTFELPWGKTTEDNLDLGSARAVLDEDHTGLDDVKERIIEHLAVRKLRHERGLEKTTRGSGTILLLVGPPGVGKTSLGESVARSLDRKFIRVALGGLRDEAEIRGHRRTYVGARPGRVARAMIEAESMNPVFLLDEMDKVGGDWRGDPSSALLEVLDPEQNHTFRDNYLEFDLDLSDVMFIATANVLETIPAPLLDRTEVIRLDGYTMDEKAEIATTHLLPRVVERSGLTSDEIDISAESIRGVVDDYTREAGVRNLERQLDKLVRKVATKVAAQDTEPPVQVEAADLRDLLGKPTVHHNEIGDRTAVPGVATGLAVTGAGGDVLFVEASTIAGEPGLTLTGQLGDVMKESAQIAVSYVRGHAAELGIDPRDLEGRIHLHVPAGAIPKDGPSAGVTMTTALVSLLTSRHVKSDVGMTGEVTLQGKVLPIGGVKQKVLAAHRAGLREIILPARNRDDLDDVPASVRDEMTFHTPADIGEVLDLALA